MTTGRRDRLPDAGTTTMIDGTVEMETIDTDGTTEVGTREVEIIKAETIGTEGRDQSVEWMKCSKMARIAIKSVGTERRKSSESEIARNRHLRARSRRRRPFPCPPTSVRTVPRTTETETIVAGSSTKSTIGKSRPLGIPSRLTGPVTPQSTTVSSLESDPTKPQLAWDGFQWVTRVSTMKTVDPNMLSKTKKVRRVQLANVPLHLGLTKDEVKKLATDFIIAHFLNDTGNNIPIHTIELNTQKNTVILELSSVEESNRIQKIDSMTILGVPCKVIRCTETIYGPEASMVAKVQNAQVI